MTFAIQTQCKHSFPFPPLGIKWQRCQKNWQHTCSVNILTCSKTFQETRSVIPQLWEILPSKYRLQFFLFSLPCPLTPFPLLFASYILPLSSFLSHFLREVFGWTERVTGILLPLNRTTINKVKTQPSWNLLLLLFLVLPLFLSFWWVSCHTTGEN